MAPLRILRVPCVLVTFAACGADLKIGSLPNGQGGGLEADPRLEQPSADGGGADHIVPVDRSTRLVFTTRETFSGDLGGVEGADARCASAASRIEASPVLLGRTFRAWIAGARPGDELADVPYVRVDGVRVALSGERFASPVHEAPLDVSEEGSHVGRDGGAPEFVWTNVSPSGDVVDSSKTCDGWLTSSGLGWAGDLEAVDATWTDLYAYTCPGQNHLYCVEVL